MEHLTMDLGTDFVEPKLLPELQQFASSMEKTNKTRQMPLNESDRRGQDQGLYPREAGKGIIILHNKCNFVWQKTVPGRLRAEDCINNDQSFSASCEAFLLSSSTQNSIQTVDTFWKDGKPLIASKENSIPWEAAIKIARLPDAEWVRTFSYTKSRISTEHMPGAAHVVALSDHVLTKFSLPRFPLERNDPMICSSHLQCVHFRVSNDACNTPGKEKFEEALRIMGRTHSVTQAWEQYAYRFKGIKTNPKVEREGETTRGQGARDTSQGERVDASLILLIVPFHAPRYNIKWTDPTVDSPTMIGILVRDDAEIDKIIADGGTQSSAN